jgi:hypothetical protein
VAAQRREAQVVRLTTSNDLRRALAEKGSTRSREFSWKKHVDELLKLASELAQNSQQPSSAHRFALERSRDVQTVRDIS